MVLKKLSILFPCDFGIIPFYGRWSDTKGTRSHNRLVSELAVVFSNCEIF